MPLTLEEAKKEYVVQRTLHYTEMLLFDGLERGKTYTPTEVTEKLNSYKNAFLELNLKEAVTFEELVDILVKGDVVVTSAFHNTLGGAYGDFEVCEVCGVHLREEEVNILSHPQYKRKDKILCDECMKKGGI